MASARGRRRREEGEGGKKFQGPVEGALASRQQGAGCREGLSRGKVKKAKKGGSCPRNEAASNGQERQEGQAR